MNRVLVIADSSAVVHGVHHIDAKERRDMVYELREKVKQLEAAQAPSLHECHVIPLRPKSGRALELARARARRRRNLRRLGWEHDGQAA